MPPNDIVNHTKDHEKNAKPEIFFIIKIKKRNRYN